MAMCTGLCDYAIPRALTVTEQALCWAPCHMTVLSSTDHSGESVPVRAHHCLCHHCHRRHHSGTIGWPRGTDLSPAVSRESSGRWRPPGTNLPLPLLLFLLKIKKPVWPAVHYKEHFLGGPRWTSPLDPGCTPPFSPIAVRRRRGGMQCCLSKPCQLTSDASLHLIRGW